MNATVKEVVAHGLRKLNGMVGCKLQGMMLQRHEMPMQIRLNACSKSLNAYAERSIGSTTSVYLGGVPATAGFGAAVAVIDGLIGGAETGGTALLRFAMICSFLRKAARRPRMPRTTAEN